MNEWISVKDRLPDENGKYLCYHRHNCYGYMDVCSFATNLKRVDAYDFYGKNRCGWYAYDSEYGYYECSYITHWMPLPEEPEN